MLTLQNMFYQMEYLGVSDIILPFLLVFTLTFVIFSKMSLFAETKRGVRVTLAIVMAMAVIFPHVTGKYYYGVDAVNIINNSLPYIGLVLIGVLGFYLLIGMFGFDFPDDADNAWKGGLVIVSLLTVLYIFGSSTGWFYNTSYIFSWLDSDLVAWIFVLVLAYLVLSWIIGDDEGTVSSGSGDSAADKKKKKEDNKKAGAFVRGLRSMFE